MNHPVKMGFSFGSTSGVITTLGLVVGLHSGTHSKLAVLGGIITIAVADAFSDALGIHISEESENKHSPKEIWQATVATFISKFVFTSIFILPVLFFELLKAIVICLVMGFVILGIGSYLLAREQNVKPWGVVFEHLLVASVVIVLTHQIGDWISAGFGTG